MASLKEVKTRIASVNSTRKITSAMKMVASSKLHRAQQAIESMRPYERQLTRIMSTFVGSMEGEVDTAYAAQRDVKRVVIVLFTSNSSLCGGYNANAVKAFVKKVEEYRSHDIEICRVYAMGKKAAEAVGKLKNFDLVDKSALLDHPSYQEAAKVASELMDLYVKGDIDEVDLIYHHFKSAGTQILTTETFLPIDLHADSTEEGATNNLNFIVEPSIGDIVNQLIPKSLHLRLYTALLDSLASEHAARVIAMQVATDNADDLLRELTLTYNKTRQQAITNELLDIAGGSAAQQ
ncbi:f0F1 ATP synthase subunit gamma [Prevotella sp. CAG:5226]|jgi:F-type H+-transporting ATPase subunit gamma|uniref:F0F1 ATP synthase subunit gamma n=1 Tax=uncultured Prevotellamassilia sp. TaxID=1926676 RepID=UPI00033ECEDC|nr:F0F1 ATP synthase subunit gamma [uncultured Prevotellamassilia sp.]CDA42402.1 f0F1 ATP synthase subunit gamma [Prevotella sp. CAG:5226]